MERHKEELHEFNKLFIRKKNLTEPHKQGMLALFKKKKDDKTLLSNWRQLCLLNIDFKIHVGTNP